MAVDVACQDANCQDANCSRQRSGILAGRAMATYLGVLT